jgi:release factor glutamine methyltransferase
MNNNKPEYLSDIDYNLLKSIYPNNMDEILSKLKSNYPVQYLIGYVDFYGYKINVDNRVLIPRFETEGLVNETIKLIKENISNPKIIDIGTGSGCIAITLSKELNIKVDAIDISKPALDLATENAILNTANINFYQKDIKNCTFDSQYNVIISNPPYVKENSEVDPKTKFEPQNALFAKDNGLEFYEAILKQSLNILEKRNLIAFEIGCDEAESIKDLAKKYYPNSIIIIKKDLANLDRYIFIVNE